MKKILAVMITAALALSLCACSKNDKAKDESSAPSETAAESSEKSAVPIKQASDTSKPESSAKESSGKESSAEVSSKTSEQKSDTSKEQSKVSEEESSAQESQAASEEPSEEESSEESTEESSEESSEEVSQESSEQSEEESSEEPSQQESSREPQKPRSSVTPSGTPVDSSWFDDALFIGDSVTLKLSYYAEYGSLGNAEFLCAGSLGYNNAQWDLYREDNVHPYYNGQKFTVDDGAAYIDPAKIFIMLGMNDIGMYGVDGAVEGMKIITQRIAEKCPNAVIYVQSVTPMLVDSQLRDLNNTTIAEFNRAIQPICQERGYIYLDVASAVDDGYGNLIYEYCGDPTAMGLHFSDTGCAVWVDYLKNHVA